MQRLKSDNKRKNFGASVLGALDLPCSDKSELRLLLARCGIDVARGALKLRALLGTSEKCDIAALDSIISSGECYRIQDMKINGDDLRELGISGKNIGDTLENLLYKIVTGEIPNEREALLAFVKR